MTEHIEAALQFGFTQNGVGTLYRCTHTQLLAFAKACECKGRAEAAELARDRAGVWGGMSYGTSAATAARNIADALDLLNAESEWEPWPAAPLVPEPAGLDQLIADATAWFEALTPEQQEAHLRAQAENWAAAEMRLDRKPT